MIEERQLVNCILSIQRNDQNKNAYGLISKHIEPDLTGWIDTYSHVI